MAVSLQGPQSSVVILGEGLQLGVITPQRVVNGSFDDLDQMDSDGSCDL